MTESQEGWTLTLAAPTERDTNAEDKAQDGWARHKDSGLRHIDATLIDAQGHTTHLSIRAHASEFQEGPHPGGPEDKAVAVLTDKYSRALAGRGVDLTGCEVPPLA